MDVLEDTLVAFRVPAWSGAEVDFVVEVGRELWGIEVKASRRADRSVVRGFRSLAQRTDRLKRRIVVYLGARPQRIDGVEVLPFEEFARLLPRSHSNNV